MTIKDNLAGCGVSIEVYGYITRVTLCNGLDMTDYYFLSTPSIPKKVYLGSLTHAWEEGTQPIRASQMVELMNTGELLPVSSGSKGLNVEPLHEELMVFLLSVLK
jgi:hypothetical protein